MAEQVWGTGYGSKRHIPDERGIRTQQRRSGESRFAAAACSPEQVFLETFSDRPDEARSVMAKTACVRCAKKAGAKPCVRCNGTGHEPA